MSKFFLYLSISKFIVLYYEQVKTKNEVTVKIPIIK